MAGVQIISSRPPVDWIIEYYRIAGRGPAFTMMVIIGIPVGRKLGRDVRVCFVSTPKEEVGSRSVGGVHQNTLNSQVKRWEKNERSLSGGACGLDFPVALS